jgi:hypothetical protein
VCGGRVEGAIVAARTTAFNVSLRLQQVKRNVIFFHRLLLFSCFWILQFFIEATQKTFAVTAFKRCITLGYIQ